MKKKSAVLEDIKIKIEKDIKRKKNILKHITILNRWKQQVLQIFIILMILINC